VGVRRDGCDPNTKVLESLLPFPVWTVTALPGGRLKVGNLYTWLSLSRRVQPFIAIALVPLFLIKTYSPAGLGDL
jgi:hypothetical protein